MQDTLYERAGFNNVSSESIQKVLKEFRESRDYFSDGTPVELYEKFEVEYVTSYNDRSRVP